MTSSAVAVPTAAATDADRDLAGAGRLQRMLLPRSPFLANGWIAAHRYEPAGVVSGDYLDLVLHGDRLYFMLGDVSGKGVVAALLMAQLHATFRTLIPFGLPMEELVRRASALLCASSLPAQYATLVFGYGGPNGDVVLANAGHPPPLVTGGDRKGEVRATGLPIGLFCESQFSTTHLTLSAGDTLLLYSDGLTEGENALAEPYGVERLEVALRSAAGTQVESVADAIVSDQAAFRGVTRNMDDLSILAVRRV